jgi:hypothetical protein
MLPAKGKTFFVRQLLSLKIRPFPGYSFYADGGTRIESGKMHMKMFCLFLSIYLVFVPWAQCQDEEKIKALFQDAIQAMGGEAYLKVADMVSNGQRFHFNSQGDSSGLIKFSDYARFPDKRRFEQGNKKNELDITIFNLGKNEGWILEGQKGTREAKPEEMKKFKEAVKHSIGNIFRFRYQDPANKFFYLGPGEGQDLTLEMVQLVDPDNDEVTIYFDRISKLPAKIEYRDISNKGIRQHIVEEFSRWHEFQGVNSPLRIDSFVNGRKLSQHFIAKISYNNNLSDSLFSKPTQPK